MADIKLPLTAYQGRSLLASAGRNVNLYAEPIDQAAESPYQYILYPTPGKTLLRNAPQAIIRCLYRASSGNCYACAGQGVYYVDPTWKWNLLGSITPSVPQDAVPMTTPVSMTDNGNVLLMCDGSVDGWYIDLTQPLASQVLVKIDRSINTGWLGADRVDYIDTFFVANSPGTDIFYCSASEPNAQTFASEFAAISSTVVSGGAGYIVGDVLTLTGTGNAQTTVVTVGSSGAIVTANVTASGGIASAPTNPVPVTGGGGSGASFNVAYTAGTGAFNPLDFAAKVSVLADNLQAVVCVQSFIWLLGVYSYEYWVDSGGQGSGAPQNNTFPFQIEQNIVKNVGCCAKYSIATVNNTVFWLSQDASGQGIIVEGAEGKDKRISTHAIETQISTYPVISDAVGYCYQQQGHYFYVLNFPSAPNYNGQADQGITFCFDLTTGQWHERMWIDANGIEHRDRANTAVNVYGTNVCGDWENSNFYQFDLTNFTDNGMPIKRLIRSGAEIDMNGNARIRFMKLIANMQVGADSQDGSGGPIQVVDVSFDGSDGTTLQTYANPNDFGLPFTDTGGTVNMEIVDDAATASATGTAQYELAGTPTTPDYTVSYNANVTNFSEAPPNGSTMYAIGRANGADDGYQAAVTSDGTNISVQLKVMPSGDPVVVELGVIASGFYSVSLTLQGIAITLAVQRSQDGTWVDPSGDWVGTFTNAIAIEDSTYTAPGNVLIGGNWA